MLTVQKLLFIKKTIEDMSAPYYDRQYVNWLLYFSRGLDWRPLYVSRGWVEYT